MSNLDILFKHYKNYVANHKLKGLAHHALVLYEDGTGYVEMIDYNATNDNPFRVDREIIIPFFTISEGMKKVEEAVHDTTSLSTECGPEACDMESCENC